MSAIKIINRYYTQLFMNAKSMEILRGFAKLLKPGPGKILIFAILLVFVIFLPLYPVHMDHYIGIVESNPTMLEESGTKMMSLNNVLEGGFNWTEERTTSRIVIWTTVQDNHLYFYDAKPLFLPVFGALGFLAYAASCYYIESTKREKISRQ